MSAGPVFVFQRRTLGNGGLVWAPTGSTLAVLDGGTLYTGTPTSLRRVASGVTRAPLPAFSLDGRFLAYLHGSLVVRRTTTLAVRMRVQLENAQVSSIAWTRAGLLVNAHARGD